MSSKKKPQVFNECRTCGWLVLTKDAAEHMKICGRSVEDSTISLLVPNTAIKGYLTEVERIMG